jgi:hypothetical protein
MTDAVQVALIAGISAAAQSMVIAVCNYLVSRKREAKRDKIIQDTHTLVNSQMGEQLMIGMVSARTLADQNPDIESYQRLAEEAERKYKEHQAKQKVVDNRKMTT